MELGRAPWSGGLLELKVHPGSRQTSGGQEPGQQLFLALDFGAHFSHPHPFLSTIPNHVGCRQHLTCLEGLSCLPDAQAISFCSFSNSTSWERWNFLKYTFLFKRKRERMEGREKGKNGWKKEEGGEGIKGKGREVFTDTPKQTCSAKHKLTAPFIKSGSHPSLANSPFVGLPILFLTSFLNVRSWRD